MWNLLLAKINVCRVYLIRELREGHTEGMNSTLYQIWQLVDGREVKLANIEVDTDFDNETAWDTHWNDIVP